MERKKLILFSTMEGENGFQVKESNDCSKYLLCLIRNRKKESYLWLAFKHS